VTGLPLPGNELSQDRYQAQLRTLMRLAFILDAAGDAVLGKGAPAMMYQAGLDAGRDQSRPAGRPLELEEALGMVLTEGEEVWHVEPWRDAAAGLDDETNGSCWFVFRRCPLLSLSRHMGSTPGGLLCQALHGHMAGSMGQMMERRVEMKIVHCGPRACKILVETRG
jgi:hypothetical protein